MNILLIGHDGYLGIGLLEYFSRRHHVIGCDKKEDLFTVDAAFLRKHSIEMVVNLSVVADFSPRFQISEPGDIVNVEGARHLARILKGSDITWIQMSTREVLSSNLYSAQDVHQTEYGYRPKFFVSEDSPYAPRNAYGKSKIMAEFISESHPASSVIRLTTAYTDYAPEGDPNWMFALIQKAIDNQPVKLSNGGLQFRDPLHTNDLGALMESVHERQVFGERIHAGGGEQNLISLREFVQMVNPAVQIESMPGGDFGFAFNIDKARRLAAWTPKVLLRERLSRLVDHVRRRITRPETTLFQTK